MSQLAATLICERVRAQISLELDGELSQLELRMVDGHVRRCAGCRTFAESAAVFTKTLRDAPLERLDRPVVVGRRRRTAALGRFQVGAAAALAVAAVGLAAQLDSGASPSASPAFGPVTRFPTNAEVRSEMALLELMQSRALGYQGNPSGAIF